MVPPAFLAQALALFQHCRFDPARDACRQHLAQHPQDAQGWHVLGLIEHARGDLTQALAALTHAEQLGARAPAQRANHAGVLNAAGQHEQALALAQAALAAAPQLPAALINAGLAAAALARHEPALDWLTTALALRPEALLARERAVDCALALGHGEQALALAVHASLLADAGRGRALAQRFPLADAARTRLALLTALTERHPEHVAIRYDHAAALHLAGLGGEAEASARCVLEREPNNSDAALMLATALFEQGRIEDGLAVLRALLVRAPDHDLAWANYLVGLHYDPALDQVAIQAEHRRWAATRLAGIAPRAARDLLHAPDPQRRLRIGWLSPRLVGGAIEQYFRGVIPAFDPAFAEHIVYHDRPDSDAATAVIRAQADHWREVGGLDDWALEAVLLADRLDVLIDLAGHAPNNRLRVLARRVAPLQTTWLDYMDTTAVPAIDFVIMDAAIAPPGSERGFDEDVLRLTPCRQTFAPPQGGPDCTWAGADDAPFTLACCNRMPKRHAGVFARYAAVLAALPRARLLLLDAAFEGAQVRAQVESRLRTLGVDLARVELLGRQPYRDLLTVYRRVDAVIDPFPYSGCTTTCDALWMGVPVLSTPGDTFYSRQSAMFLQAIDRGDWLCADQAGLIAALQRLADDPRRRSGLRAELRARMQATVCDPRLVVAGLQSGLRERWQRLCTQGDA